MDNISNNSENNEAIKAIEEQITELRKITGHWVDRFTKTGNHKLIAHFLNVKDKIQELENEIEKLRGE